MSKAIKEKKDTIKNETYEALKALYYSGKVKPSLTKILAELKNNPENLEFTLLACQCMVRTKNFDDLYALADTLNQLDPKHGAGYFYKGVAIQHTKGKEQEALNNFNEAIAIEPENTLYLKNKATTHLSLYKDYHLPIKFAEKHRVKAEEGLMSVIKLIQEKENPTYLEYLTLSEVSILVSQSHDAKMYFIKAVNTFNDQDPTDQDKNIYKDILKAQRDCIKEMEKFSEF